TPTLFSAYARTWYLVLGSSPDTVAENVPDPVPEGTNSSSRVGCGLSPQQKPLAVISALPLSVILPLITAELMVISVACPVVRVARTGSFTQLCSNNEPMIVVTSTINPGMLVLPDISIRFV